MSDHTTNTTPNGSNGIAHREGHSPSDCSGCGETSHILLPLADLLKAVASTLQAHPSHPLAEHPIIGSETPSDLGALPEVPSVFGKGAFSHAFRSVFDKHAAAHRPPEQSDIGIGKADKTSAGGTSPFNVQAFTAGAPLAEAQTPGREGVPPASDAGKMPAPPGETDSVEDDVAAPVPNGAESVAQAVSTSADSASQVGTDEQKEPVSTQEPPAAGRRTRLPRGLFASKQEKKAQSNASNSSPWGDEEELAEPPKMRFKNWHGIDGVAVMLFGVVFPALVCLGACASVPKRLTLIMLEHPVETIAELALLLLVPLTNYALWSAFRRDDMRLSLKRGLSLGSAMCTSFIISGVTFAALMQNNGQMMQSEIGTTFEAGFTWLAALSCLAGCATAYILFRHLKARDFVQSRRLILAYTAIGAILSAFTLVGAEAKSWYVRMSERMAVSNHATERAEGLAQLKSFYSERELRMECTDSRAAGLCGLFYPIKADAQKELYFRLTGKPFSFHDQNNDLSTMPDDYVSHHAVGDMVPGLSMVRSEMSAAVHPQTLTSSIDWTFVYRNESYGSQEARSEIGLPSGAVITGMTEWVNGEQVHGTFTATGKAQHDSTLDASYSPATIVDLGHSRALLRCSSVQPDAEVKVALRMIVPLQPENLRAASLALPKLIATNFSLEDENAVKLYSPLKISSDFNDLHNSTAGGGIKMLSGQLVGKRLQSAEVIVSVARPEAKSEGSITVLDKLAVKLAQEDEKRLAEQRRKSHGNYTPLPQQLTVIVDGREGIKSQLDALASQLNQHKDAHGQRPRIKTVKPQFVVQKVAQVKSPAPRQLVIVVDGSDTMKAHVAELKKALSAVPREFPVKMLIASQDNPKLSHEVSLSHGLDYLDPANFGGGQNNLKSVIDAAEDAGTVKGSAILWIHGPQPVSSSEMYITTPYGAPPSLYELPIESGEIDTSEFFKNHNDVGSFKQVSHRNSLEKDIACFFAKWEPNSADYAVSMTTTDQKSAAAMELPESEGREVLQLNAYEKCMQFLADHKPRSAARIAVAYGILTPVSCVLIENQQQQQPEQTQHDEFAGGGSQSAQAPALEGATNGTIGPQGADATYVTGLNTAGTVRVNNLANLEALLNLIANGSEIGALIAGLGFAISGFMTAADGKRDKGKMARRLAIGVAIIVVGMSIPGCINWLVASARDANLFS